MRHFLLLAVGLALSSCVAQHQFTPPRPPQTEPLAVAQLERTPYEAAPGYLAPPLGFDARGPVRLKAERKETRVLRKWHRQFRRQAKRTKSGPAAEASLSRKCKGCTIVYGTATVAGKKATVAAGAGAVASHVEKKAGPAVVASDSVSQNVVAGPGNIQATNGNGNAPQLTAPVQQAADWRAVLARPAGYVLAGLVTVLVVGGLVGGFVRWRKQKGLQNLV